MIALGLRAPAKVDPDKLVVKERLQASERRLHPVLTALRAAEARRVVREAGQR